MTLYCDLDGTLADLDSHYENLFGVRPDKVADNVDWDKVREVKDFYLTMPPMPDMAELWAFIAPFNPIILTGVPRSVEEAPGNKKAWVAKHLGPDVAVYCTRSSAKFEHCKPGDILIDDWEKYQLKWQKAGGIWITHTNAASTIQQLKRIGIDQLFQALQRIL